MKEQFLITSNSRANWSQNVNRFLNQGWLVVPGTLFISSGIRSDNRNGYITVDSESEFAVVVEREFVPAE
jgi:hypothetical protein